jgi:sortase A
MNPRRSLFVLALISLGAGSLLLAEQVWLKAKAEVAEVLIDRAFDAYLADGKPHPPWGWADTHPVARIEIPRLGISRTVLAGASGSSLAFGPGHIDGSARPNAEGNCVLAGHRDSWFAFLEDLREQDELRLVTREGLQTYRVERIEIRSMWEANILEPTAQKMLRLVTCYPFDGLRGAELRYVVTCLPQPGAQAAAASTMPTKDSASSAAPPIRPPSTSGCRKICAALAGLTLPPY